MEQFDAINLICKIGARRPFTLINTKSDRIFKAKLIFLMWGVSVFQSSVYTLPY